MIDSYYEHKRFLKQKHAALHRELIRDRLALKDKTIALIEQQVEEQRQKLSRDIDQSIQDEKRAGLKAKLADQRHEFEHKMKVIEEIKLQKFKQEEQERMVREAIAKRKAEQNKYLA